jgi:hypothetical protein
VVTGNRIMQRGGQAELEVVASDAVSSIAPFLTTRKGEILAGSFARSATGSRCWALPSEALDGDPAAWVAAAIREWQELSPSRFPTIVDWTTSSRWQTTEEQDLAARLNAIVEERTAMIAALVEQARAISDELATATEQADNTVRRLLTAQGDELVDEVLSALGDLGFKVSNMDDHWPSNDKREDLRVSDPEDPEWIAIVEVRGYRPGAALRDLQRIGRFSKRFARDEGRVPDAEWYVVNHFLNDPPDTRPLPLAGNDAEIDDFALGDGLIVDTRDLFRLHRRAIAGTMSPKSARDLMKQSRGRLVVSGEDQPAG